MTKEKRMSLQDAPAALLRYEIASASRLDIAEIPDNLCTYDFCCVWIDWVEFRRNVFGELLSPISERMQLKQLAEWQFPVEAVKQSIVNRSKTIYPTHAEKVVRAVKENGRKDYLVRSSRNARTEQEVIDTVPKWEVL